MKKTAKMCSECVTKIINKCKEEFKKDIFAIVSDNENKMKKMKQLLQE